MDLATRPLAARPRRLSPFGPALGLPDMVRTTHAGQAHASGAILARADAF